MVKSSKGSVSSLFQTSNFFIKSGLLLSLCLVFATGGYLYWKNEQLQKVQIEQQAKPKDQKIISQNVLFKSKVVPIRSKTTVKMTYKMPPKGSEMFLGFDTIEGKERVMIIIDHPLFRNLDWAQVTNLKYTLFQKERKYLSVEEFLKNPPQDKVIAVDPLMIDNKVIPSTNPKAIDEITNINAVDYILTTYHTPYNQDDYLVSEAVVDATDAVVENDLLYWSLTLPQVSEENPLMMEGIDINFNQPVNTVSNPK